MDIWNKICGFFVIFIFAYSFSQGQIFSKYSTVLTFKPSEIKTTAKKDSLDFSQKFSMIGNSNPLPGNFYTQHFGFFCKKELMIEKAIKIPVKLRLGSLEYCNYLEAKSGSRNPYR